MARHAAVVFVLTAGCHGNPTFSATQLATPAPSSLTLRAVCEGGVVIGDQGFIMADAGGADHGSAWTVIREAKSGAANLRAITNDCELIVGDRGTVLYSLEGSDYKSVPFADIDLRGTSHSGGGWEDGGILEFVAGQGGLIAEGLPPSDPLLTVNTGGGDIAGIATCPDVLAIRAAGGVVTSPDFGKTWHDVSPTLDVLRGVGCAGDGSVAVGDNGAVVSQDSLSLKLSVDQADPPSNLTAYDFELAVADDGNIFYRDVLDIDDVSLVASAGPVRLLGVANQTEEVYFAVGENGAVFKITVTR